MPGTILSNLHVILSLCKSDFTISVFKKYVLPWL